MAKEVLRNSIYPSQDELRNIAEEFLAENYSNLYGRMTKKKWLKVYEREIYSEVSLYDLTR